MRPLLVGARFLAFLLLSLTPVLLLTDPASGVVRRVNDQGTGDFPTIQAALEVSSAGDTVLVAPGLYTWDNQGTGDEYGLIRYWQSEQDGVDLVSEAGPEATILDAQFKGRVFFANGNNIPSDPVTFVIDGFTLRNGVAPAYANRPEREGGGMAMHLCYPVIRNCVFQNNRAEYGGGVWLGGLSSYRFEDCRFVGNRAQTSRGVNTFGGGLLVVNSQQLTVIERCTFEDNMTSYRGGGVMLANARVDMIDCVFTGNYSTNSSTGNGSALYLFDVHEAHLDRIFVRDNDTTYGAAVLVRRYQNQAMTATLSNSLIADNPPGRGLVVDAAPLAVSCTNIYGHPLGNWLGSLADQLGQNGNISVDPLFCSETAHLQWVRASSPMLAAHNSCGVDVGGVLGGCATVPVAVSSFEARWVDGRATIQLELAEGLAGLQALRVVREVDGLPAREVGLDWARARAGFDAVDADAPAVGATYRLLTDAGEEVSRARLGPRRFVPARTQILAASPNPFNPRTNVRFATGQEGPVRVRVYGVSGRLVRDLLDASLMAGEHSVEWDGTDDGGRAVASGTYVVRLETEQLADTRSVVLVK